VRHPVPFKDRLESNFAAQADFSKTPQHNAFFESLLRRASAHGVMFLGEGQDEDNGILTTPEGH